MLCIGLQNIILSETEPNLLHLSVILEYLLLRGGKTNPLPFFLFHMHVIKTIICFLLCYFTVLYMCHKAQEK